MARRKPPENKIEEPNMTPMIDVIFQLLIFFLVGCKFKALDAMLKSYLPKDKGLMPTPVLNPELREIRIKIKPITNTYDAQILIEKRMVGTVTVSKETGREPEGNRAVWESLFQLISQHFATMKSSPDWKNVPCIVEGHPDAAFQFIVKAVDMAKKAGVERVEFAGNPEFENLKGR